MIEVEVNGQFDPELLNKVTRLANPNIYGVRTKQSTNPQVSSYAIVDMPDGASAVDISLMQTIMAQYNTLGLSVDNAVIPADDTTLATITLNTADAELAWCIVDSLGDIVGEGDANPVAGVLTLTFKTSVSDAYDIWVIRKTADFATGKVRVTATEV